MLALRRLGFAGSVFLVAASACSDWPPGSHDSGTNNSGPSAVPQQSGTCSGTPLPCSGLTTAECAASAGCVDNGTCAGDATTIGETCGTQFSVANCNGTPGCYWATNCTGTPFGTCSAITQQSCLSAVGCVWTPTAQIATGTGGAAACPVYGAACTTIAQCGCGLGCVSQCSGCQSVCGHACQTNADCVSQTDLQGTLLPNCVVLAAAGQIGFTGLCSL